MTRRTGASTTRRDALRAAEEALWAAVRESTGHSHEILGELARDSAGHVAILARTLATGRLVVLTTSLRAQAGDTAPAIAEHFDLGPAVPAPPESCRACGTPFADWERRCPICAAEEPALVAGAAPGMSRDELLVAVDSAATGQFDVLGDLQRARDGALVYFGREATGGRLAVLRLLREPASAGSARPAFVLAATPCAATPAATGEAAAFQAAPPPASGDFSKVCPQCGAMYGSVLKFCPADGAGLRSLASPTDLIGQVIADRFFVTDKLGEGGMGEVYLAEHVQLGRRCALKVMRKELLNDADAAARFRREAMNASGISHPNVATIFDFVEAPDGLTYLVMEYVDGESLSDLLGREGALAPWRAAVICRQVAAALAAAHELGIVHRDLKPDNVMISAGKDGRERVKVVDFGIAKAVESAQQQVTRTGFLIGTPAFMSPEQLVGDPIDGRSDLFSLGCILFEMLTGRRAFEGSFNVASIARRLDASPPRPSAVDASIPAPLDEIVARLLARSPEDRFASAVEVVDVLAPIAADAPDGVTSGSGAGAGSGLMITGVEVRPFSSGGRTVPPAPKSPAVARARPQGASSAHDRALADAPTEAAPTRRTMPVLLHWLAAAVVLAAASAAAWQLSGAGNSASPLAEVAPVADRPLADGDGGAETHPAGRPDGDAQASARPESPADAGGGAGLVPGAPGDAGAAASRAPVNRARDRASSARSTAADAGATTAELAAGDAAMRRASALADGGRVDDAVRQLEAAEAGYRAALGIVVARRDSIAAALARQAAAQPVRELAEAGRDSNTAAPPPAGGGAPPPPVADPRAADRAQVAVVRDVVERYVQAFGSRDVQTLRHLFPGLPAGTERSMREATEWSATLSGEPAVTVTGPSAAAEFTYVLQYHLPSTGRQRQTVPLRATLQRSGDAWTIVQLSSAR